MFKLSSTEDPSKFKETSNLLRPELFDFIKKEIVLKKSLFSILYISSNIFLFFDFTLTLTFSPERLLAENDIFTGNSFPGNPILLLVIV